MAFKDANCIKELDGALIVSSQASLGEPMCAPEHIVAMALSAIAGGARALRLEGIENIAAARHDTRLPGNIPIVGLVKSEKVPAEDRLKVPYITNTWEDAQAIASAGADVVALDATDRPRPDGFSVQEVIARIHSDLRKPAWADVSTFAEGIKAAEYGADIISTTLFGYTEETTVPRDHGPGFDLLRELVSHCSVPIVLEGRVWYPEEVSRAFELGAYAVVVGSAITRPILITERFVRAVPSKRTRKSPV
ncbi:MAG: N-acetylmannosamine-6-phosphate 2-epimerase [Terriglobales bacterium]